MRYGRKKVLRQLIGLPIQLFAALGEVTVRYGQIEHLLTMTIHRTAKLSYDESYEYVKNMKNQKQSKEAKECFEEWAKSKFGENEGARRSAQFNDLLKAWIENDKCLAGRRHDVVHCCWSIKDGQLGGTRKGDLLEVDGHSARTEDVEMLANNLRQFVVQLNRATMPETLSGAQEEIAGMPDNFSESYIIPMGIGTSSTCASTPIFAMFEFPPRPSGD